MVIQRIQTLFLLVASVLMAVVCFLVPIAQIAGTEGAEATFYIYDMPALLVLNLIIAVILFVAIFLYKNLPLQIRVTRICIVLTVVAAIILGYLFCTLKGDAMWAGATSMMIISFICELMALYGMNKDYKLLRSYDRLR